jgi:hypothetical protein
MTVSVQLRTVYRDWQSKLLYSNHFSCGETLQIRPVVFWVPLVEDLLCKSSTTRRSTDSAWMFEPTTRIH